MGNMKSIFLLNQGNIGSELVSSLEKEFNVQNANSDVETLKLLNGNLPKIIVLNTLTYEYGSVIVDMIRSNSKFNYIPIIIITKAANDLEDWFKLGVTDCIDTKYKHSNLINKINAILQITEKISQIKEENEVYKSAALIDLETGLFNKKYLSARLQGEISRATRQGEPISFVLVDIDDFNVLADSYGKDAKDFVLRQTTSMIKQTVRLSDIVVRYGVNRIGVLCPITDRSGVEAFVEKLRTLIDKNSFNYNNIKIKTNISIGAYTLGTSDFNSIEKKNKNILAFTEEALLRAKKNEHKIEFFD